MSLRLKTILGIATIEAVLLIVLISSVLSYMRNLSEQNLLDYADTTVTLFSTATKDAIISFDLASLEDFVGEILENEGVLYARILGPNNSLLAQSGERNILDRPFIADSTLGDVNDGVFDHYAEVREGGASYGRVEIGISIEKISETLTEVKKKSALIAIVEMFLVAVFSFFLGMYLTRQLRYLRIATKQIAKGDLGHEIPVKGKDELADVALSFNKMVSALRLSDLAKEKYHMELEQLNDELEERVKKRTIQLSNKNTELETAYEKLKSTQIKLFQSEKMASLGQMAAGVAHEINNPIAFIRGNFSSMTDYFDVYKKCIDDGQKLIELIKNGNHVEAENIIKEIEKYKKREDIDFIQSDISDIVTESIEGIDRISDISQGLKNFSHVDQSEIIPTDINACINETLTMIAGQIKGKCTITTDLQPLPEILCNPGKINQVFMNVLTNANQAVETNGCITIKTAVNESWIEIRIADTGLGISPENMSKIFDPFFTTRAVGAGSGLGLSISHGIIEEHEGTIEAQSEANKGTEFLIKLPIRNE